MTTSRAALRQRYIAARHALDTNERNIAQQQIHTYLDQAPRVRQARVVAAFMSTRDEVDLSAWFTHRAEDRLLALPVVGQQSGTMTFHLHDPRDSGALVANRYGILEPAPGAPRVDAGDIDVMLTPLVAFDASGNRLGMGGGYYDRYLAAASPRPYLLGIAFACQQAPTVPTRPWDIRLDAVVTEAGVLEFS